MKNCMVSFLGIGLGGVLVQVSAVCLFISAAYFVIISEDSKDEK